jgi:hypothetical protein
MSKQTGQRCGARVAGGFTVCYWHGARAPQVRATAEERMRALVHPAVSALQQLIAGNDLAAARYVLDYAGFKAKEKLETSGETTIRYVNDWRRSPSLPSSQFEVSEEVVVPMAEHRNGETAPDQ